MSRDLPNSDPARDEAARLVLRRHDDVVAAALDTATWSSAVSHHLQIPNGLDGAEHAGWRAFVDQFLTQDRTARAEPVLARVVAEVVREIAAAPCFDALELGSLTAVRCQTAWLGWSADLEPHLLAWVAENRAAARAGDRARLAAGAERFDTLIHSELDRRRGATTVAPPDLTVAPPDLTAELMAAVAPHGEPARDEELVSVLRNWTGGDLSSLALCIGVVVHWLATHPEHHAALREASDSDVDAAIDEMLRLDDPFVSNRRVATRDVVVAGCPVEAGEQVVLHWRDANQDPAAVDSAATFDPAGHASRNLVYGVGPHVCPGRSLSTLQLRLVLREVLATGTVELAGPEPLREESPVAGFREVMVRVGRPTRS